MDNIDVKAVATDTAAKGAIGGVLGLVFGTVRQATTPRVGPLKQPLRVPAQTAAAWALGATTFTALRTVFLLNAEGKDSVLLTTQAGLLNGLIYAPFVGARRSLLAAAIQGSAALAFSLANLHAYPVWKAAQMTELRGRLESEAAAGDVKGDSPGHGEEVHRGQAERAAMPGGTAVRSHTSGQFEVRETIMGIPNLYLVHKPAAQDGGQGEATQEEARPVPRRDLDASESFNNERLASKSWLPVRSVPAEKRRS